MSTGLSARKKTLTGAAALSAAAFALGGCTPSTSQASGSPTQSTTQTTTTQSTTTQSGASTAPGGSQSTASAPAATGASTTASGSSGSSGTPACANGQLKITPISAGAGDGHVADVVVFTNTGSGPCSVSGYPGAAVTDSAGTKIVLNATRQLTGYLGGQYANPSTMVLAPGATASTVVEWVDAPPNGQSPVGANCPGMDGGKLLITPPNTTQAQSFPVPSDLCTAFEVHPLVPGSSGRASS